MAATRAFRSDREEDNLDPYFREMSVHDVLTAEQELALAQDIERREIAAWSELFLFPPVARAILAGPLRRLDRAVPEREAVERALADGIPLGDAVRALATALAAWDRQRRLRQAIVADLGKPDGRLAALDPAEPVVRVFLRRVGRAEALATSAREAFITANLRLVVLIARRFRGRGLALPDLVQEGNLGLLRAVDRFDYRKGFRFSTFASWWIMASVRRGALDKGKTVRIPVHLVDEQRRIHQIRRDLEGRLGRPVTGAELCDAAGVSTARLAEIEGATRLQPISLDKPTGDDDDGNIYEVLVAPDDAAAAPEQLDQAATARALERLIHELSPVEADVIRRRYGMGDADEQTLAQIGEDYDRSRERIRQIESRALAKLRRALRRADRPAAMADGGDDGDDAR